LCCVALSFAASADFAIDKPAGTPCPNPQPAVRPLQHERTLALDDTERLTQLESEEILNVDLAAQRGTINRLLLRTSELVRAEVPGPTEDHRGADLMGAKLQGADLREATQREATQRGATQRGATLIAADLRGADLRIAVLIGADLRGSIFLTQSQVNAAKGYHATRLNPSLGRPSHWSSARPQR